MSITSIGRKLCRTAESLKTEPQLLVANRMLENACKMHPRHDSLLRQWFKLGLVSNKWL